MGQGLTVLLCEKGNQLPGERFIPFFCDEDLEDIGAGHFTATLRDCIQLAENCGDRVIEIRDAEGAILFDGLERWKSERIEWHQDQLAHLKNWSSAAARARLEK